MKGKRHIQLAAAVGAMVLLGAQAQGQGQLIGVEDFGIYTTPDGSGLAGRLVPNAVGTNPDGGQAAPDPAVSGIANWKAQSNPWGPYRAVEGDLIYPGAVSSGGQHMLHESSGLRFRAEMDVSPTSIFNNDADPATDYIGSGGPWIGDPDEPNTLFFSTLIQITPDPDNGFLLSSGVVQNNLQFRWDPDGSEELGDPENEVPRFTIGQGFGSGNFDIAGFDAGPIDSDVHMVVLGMDFSSGTGGPTSDQLRVWWDPDLSDVANEIASPDLVNEDIFLEFSEIRSVAQGNDFNVDELRWGTSFEAVTVGVDEPGDPNDLNGDGNVDSGDIDFLFANLGTGDPALDLSGPGNDGQPDGAVDDNDVSYFVEVALNTFFGDANLDLAVDVTDLGRLGLNFGQSDTEWADGDFTGDSVVDVTDLGRLGLNFGSSNQGAAGAPVVAVPEPTAVALLGLGGLALLRRRR